MSDTVMSESQFLLSLLFYVKYVCEKYGCFLNCNVV